MFSRSRNAAPARPIPRVLSSLLQWIRLLVLVAVCALTSGLGLFAAWSPARRAARVDAATTLRTQ